MRVHRRSDGRPGRGRYVRRRIDWRSDAGTSTVELVITMPALLFLVLTIIQFGLWAHAQHVAQAAAQEGAAVARAVNGTEAAARDRASTDIERFGPTILRDPAVAVTRTPTEAVVTVTGKATSVLGVFSLPVKEQARGPIERFIGGAS